LQLLEWWSGARLLYNLFWVGGVAFDLPMGFLEKLREFLPHVAQGVEEIKRLLLDNRIFIERTAGVGVIPLDVAVAYGASGPVLRGSGLAWDLRRVRPYGVYPELEFEVPYGQGQMGALGDCWDRTFVRYREIQESLRILYQVIEILEKRYPGGRDFDPRGFSGKKMRLSTEVNLYASIEGARGEIGFSLIGQKGQDRPQRLHARSPSFTHLAMLPALIGEGMWLADLVALVGSLDVVMCEVDR
jgi:NADH-quinone oxidoreductase subunit D